MDIVERLSQALSQRQKKGADEIGDRTRAAVLVPFYNTKGEYHILFTRRTNKVAYHKGQISFPGGAREAVDPTLLETALRESWEEIGLEANAVKVLGELDDVATVTSNFIISPFVVLITSPDEFRINREEAEEIILIPLSALHDRANFREETTDMDGTALPVYFYEYQGQVVWGATAMILKQLLDVIDSTGTTE